MKYPVVLVHGYDVFDDVYASAREAIKNAGIECYSPHVGPFSGMWDRACEIYAMLKGGTVDYGKIHSERCHHERYGKTYEKGMIPDWGEKTDGETLKVNLVGHSFGGLTIRALLHLLEEGSQEEIEGTEPEELSELFKGGHTDWVNCIYTLASPHRGTTCVEGFYAGLKLLSFKDYTKANLNSGTDIELADQYDLDRFGFTSADEKIDYQPLKISRLLNSKEDNIYYELTPKGVKELTKDFKTYEDIYYFAVAADCTEMDGNKVVPKKDVPDHYKDSCALMAFYPDKKYEAMWLRNDGRVPVASALYPEGAPHKYYDPSKKPERGIWHVMPIEERTHSEYIGSRIDKDEYLQYMVNLAEFIINLD